MDRINRSNAEPSKQRTTLKASCKTCYTKKIRCDRKFPCGRCTRLKIPCEVRRRKPRADPQGEPGFWNRLSRLESIVNKLGDQIEGHDAHGSDAFDPSIDDPIGVPDSQEEATEKRISASTISIDSFIGHSLWASLADEVHALREALEIECTPSTHEDMEASDASSSRKTTNDLMFGSPPSVPSSRIFMQPAQRMRIALFEAYSENVDRSFKLLHLPTIRAVVEHGKCYLGKGQSAPGNTALKATMWFAAVNSLSETQCLSLFGTSKCEQIEHFRRNTEIALAEADILNTTDLATLQALALYIVRSLLGYDLAIVLICGTGCCQIDRQNKTMLHARRSSDPNRSRHEFALRITITFSLSKRIKKTALA